MQGLHKLARARSIILTLAALGVLAAAGLWLADRARYVHTSDARVAAHMIAVSSAVAGQVVDLPVSEGDTVDAGQLLLKLDPREAHHAAEALVFDARAIDAEILRETARADLTRRAGASRIEGRQSSSAASTSDLKSARAIYANAAAEFERIQSLRASGLVAQPTLERASDALERARQSVAAAEAAIAATRAGIDEATVEAEETIVIAHTIEALQLTAQSLRQQASLQNIILERHAIKSPISGVMDELFVDDGEHVAPGQRIALLHNPDDLWIDANIKETEIGRIRPGARVLIAFDAWPGQTFTGRIGLIRTAALSEFALMPSANVSGVFTKITQRVPVRILLDAGCPPLRPGAMASLRIRAMAP